MDVGHASGLYCCKERSNLHGAGVYDGTRRLLLLGKQYPAEVSVIARAHAGRLIEHGEIGRGGVICRQASAARSHNVLPLHVVPVRPTCITGEITSGCAFSGSNQTTRRTARRAWSSGSFPDRTAFLFRPMSRSVTGMPFDQDCLTATKLRHCRPDSLVPLLFTLWLTGSDLFRFGQKSPKRRG